MQLSNSLKHLFGGLEPAAVDVNYQLHGSEVKENVAFFWQLVHLKYLW
jgi:hypothetical protein